MIMIFKTLIYSIIRCLPVKYRMIFLRVLEVFEEPVLGNIFIDKFETLTILFAGGPQQILALCLKYAGKGGGRNNIFCHHQGENPE